MKALVLWADGLSPNLGVRALAHGTASLLGQAFPGVEVAFQSTGRKGPAPIRIDDPKVIIKDTISGRRQLHRWLESFDLVVDTRSGDSFADVYGSRRMVSMSMVAEAVRRAGVPLVLGPQTIGPFNASWSRALARRSLKHASLIMARDSVSGGFAAGLGHPVDLLTTDVVFALPKAEATGHYDVLLNPSGLLWTGNEHVDSARYQQLLISLCKAVMAEGRTITLLSHVLASSAADNDVPAAQALSTALGVELEQLVPASLAEVRSMVASASVVIGSRMHACLNALSVGTPAIPLAYSRKFAPLFNDLGWRHTIDLRGTDDIGRRAQTVLGDDGLAAGVADVRVCADELLSTAAPRLADVVER